MRCLTGLPLLLIILTAFALQSCGGSSSTPITGDGLSEPVEEEGLPADPTEPDTDLPGDPEESDPEESDPEESDPEESDPEESDPEESDPEESDPEESDPEESDPEESDPNDPSTSDLPIATGLDIDSSIPLQSSCVEEIGAYVPDSRVDLQNYDSDCDYLVTEDVVFSSGVTIEPGTTIMMSPETSLRVFSIFSAAGTASNPIRFIGTTSDRGTWDSLELLATADVEHVLVAGGGFGGTPAVRASNGRSLSMFSSEIINSGGVGIKLGESTDILNFFSNRLAGNASYGLSAAVASLPLLNGTNTFDSNAAPNGDRGLFVNGNVVVSSGAMEIPGDLGTPINFNRLPDTHIRIRPGAEIWIIDDSSDIFAFRATSIDAIGTEEQPIVIKRAPNRSRNWPYFEASSPVSWGSYTFEHVVLEDGGAPFASISAENGPDRYGTIVANGVVSLTIRDSTIRGSETWAINCREGVDPTLIVLSNVVFENNRLGDIHPECGL